MDKFIKIALVILSLVPIPSYAQNHSTNILDLKWVEFGEKYKLQVPTSFTVTEIDRSVSEWQAFSLQHGTGTFESPDFSVQLLPYSVNLDPIWTDCKVSQEFDQGHLPAPIYCERKTLSAAFVITNNRPVYFTWASDDTSLACTMNSSPCPQTVPADTRYLITFHFFIPDKPNGSILEFDAIARKSKARFDEHDPDARLLRDVVIPSLTHR